MVLSSASVGKRLMPLKLIEISDKPDVLSLSLPLFVSCSLNIIQFDLKLYISGNYCFFLGKKKLKIRIQTTLVFDGKVLGCFNT